MRKTTLILLLLIPALAFAQVELGPFVFLDKSKAYNVTVDAVIGSGGLSMGASAETPAPKALRFLDFIPGYATRYMVSIGDGLYGEATVVARARYQPKRKAIGFVGLGPGLGLATKKTLKIEPTVSVVLGIDYLINDKYLISVVVRSVGLLTIGFGLHKRYGW
ncbi:hypothetical protein ES703_08251 [subsurface metagenome]|nr:hypothetical protein [Dehalococcoidia bacterium]